MPIKDYNTDPDFNTTISGINIAEGCAPSGINNAIRQLMADVKAEKVERDAAQDERDAAQDEAIISASHKSVTDIAIDGLELVLTYGDGSEERKELPAGKSVGDLWFGIDPNSKPAGVQLYAGQLLSRAAYEAHSELVFSGKRTVLTEEEWQAQVSANGFCPFYSSGDGSTTYRFPLIKGVHPKFVAALAEAGQHIKAGSPNITGNIGGMGNRFFLDSLGTYGAFQATLPNKANMIQQTGTDLSGYQMYYRSNFDASRCSSVYRDDIDTIQPEALTMVVGEWVVGSVATLGESDAESLLASVSTLESNVGALTAGVANAEAIGAEGRTKIVGWGMPDYSAGVSFANNTDFTAPADGIVLITGWSLYNQHSYYYLNGITVGQIPTSQGNLHATFTMLVSKGDIFKMMVTGGIYYSNFYPLKGA